MPAPRRRRIIRRAVMALAIVYDAGMAGERIVLTVLMLVGWVALWWLAVRVIRGQHYDVAESALIDSLLVAVFAFAGPIMIADLIATQDWGFVESL